jgi:hypothetical protein
MERVKLRVGKALALVKARVGRVVALGKARAASRR